MIETPLEVVRIEMECQSCGEGRMYWTGVTLTSYPPQFPHVCSNCSARHTYLEHYPTLKYKEKQK